jgi:hypothetical protein
MSSGRIYASEVPLDDFTHEDGPPRLLREKELVSSETVDVAKIKPRSIRWFTIQEVSVVKACREVDSGQRRTRTGLF